MAVPDRGQHRLHDLRGRSHPRRRSRAAECSARDHQSGTISVMSQRAVAHPQESTIARTIRMPGALRKRIQADAERCGRSFEGQVIALLRRHYGEDVDIAPGPDGILALAVASLAEIPVSERNRLTQKLEERER